MAGMYALHEQAAGRESFLPEPTWQWLDDIISITAEEAEQNTGRGVMDDME
jgi:hypothetical protein